MSFERKTALQGVCSFAIFAVLAALSLISPPAGIKSTLNTSYSAKGWQDFFAVGTNAVKKGIQKTKTTYSQLVKRDDIAPEAIDTSPAASAQAQTEEAPETAKIDVPAKWTAPAKGAISSRFGEREHPVDGEEKAHTGIDIAANEGDTVVAAYPGTVASTGCDSANGNYVVIDHGENLTTTYIHLKTISITVGEYASPEVKIGEVGSTGISTGPHLHFEIKKDGKSVNPEEYIAFDKG